MRDAIACNRALNGHRLHQAAAGCRAIARVHIDMFAPQAAGAVIRVSIARHRRAAFFAHEIFRALLELGAHAAIVPIRPPFG